MIASGASPAGLVGQTCGVEMTVYVEDWQLDCCGEPFSVGSHVSWTLIRGRSDWIQTILGPGTGVTVGADECSHGAVLGILASCAKPLLMRRS